MSKKPIGPITQTHTNLHQTPVTAPPTFPETPKPFYFLRPSSDSLLTGPSWQKYTVPAVIAGAAFYAAWHYWKSGNRERWEQTKIELTSPSRKALGMVPFEETETAESTYRQQQIRLAQQSQPRRVVQSQAQRGEVEQFQNITDLK